MDSIRKLQPAVDEVIGIFLKKFESLEGQSIDLGYFLQAFAFGVCSPTPRDYQLKPLPYPQRQHV